MEAAGELGYPVVVKTAEAGAHETRDWRCRPRARRRGGCPCCTRTDRLPALVQPMVEKGAEAPRRHRPGSDVQPPLVAFGPGGVLAELIGEAGFRIAPLTDADADELVKEGKAGRLVAGYRGAPAANADGLRDLLHRLSRLAMDLPEIAELDLNPVIAIPDRVVAVDARARVRRVEQMARSKTSVAACGFTTTGSAIVRMQCRADGDATMWAWEVARRYSSESSSASTRRLRASRRCTSATHARAGREPASSRCPRRVDCGPRRLRGHPSAGRAWDRARGMPWRGRWSRPTPPPAPHKR